MRSAPTSVNPCEDDEMSSTMVLRGARLVPFDDDGAARTGDHADGPSAPGLVDVAVADGRIMAVAPHLTTAGADDVVDLEGRWLMPGLWDAHVHMSQWALDRQRVDVGHARSASEAAAIMAEHARLAAPPPGIVLVGRGFRDGLWPDQPSAALLDAALEREGVGRDVAVVVVSGDLHAAWFSTAALVLLGGAGHPTGVMRETEWMGRMGAIDAVSPEVLDAWVDDAAAVAAARGVVGLVDFEIADNLSTWTRRIAGGQRSLRVEAGVWREYLDRAVALELATGDEITGTDGLLRLGALKIISDGSLNTRTAYCADPYPDRRGEGAYGTLNTPKGELTTLLAYARGKGIAAAVHAIGDRAVALALDAFEASGARGSIEHAQLVGAADAARMARLGLIASVQPEHAMDDRDVADTHWAGRTADAFPYGTLARAGVRLALGSDAPVAPLDPWAAIAAAVYRSRDGREPWHPEQRIDLDTALAASVRSRIAVGEVADVVVLDADPYAAATPEELRAVPVAATLLAGRWTHSAL